MILVDTMRNIEKGAGKMFKFFHLCDHSILSKNAEPFKRLINVRNDGDEIDVIFEGGIVKEILGVRALTYTPRVKNKDFDYDDRIDPHTYEDEDVRKGLYDGNNPYYVDYSKYYTESSTLSALLPVEFYRPYLHNRIKWNVEPPLTYEVEAIVQFSHKRTEEYTPSTCPRCQGKGWFVDILNNSGRFNADNGVMKIAQRVVKDLLTELQSNVLNLEYGTLLRKTITGVVKEDEELFDDVRLIVSSVEDRYLLRQQEEYFSLDPEERLVKLWLLKMNRSPIDVRILVMELQIETEAEIRTFRFGV